MTKLLDEAVTLIKECDRCANYIQLNGKLEHRLKPLLQSLLSTPLHKPVRDHVNPDECCPSVAAFRDFFLEKSWNTDDLWYFFYYNCASFLQNGTRKRTREDSAANQSTLVTNLLVFFGKRPPPKLENLNLRWRFLKKNKASYEAKDIYLNANASERRRMQLNSVLSIFSERGHRHHFTTVWLYCIERATEAALHLHLLYFLPDVVLPFLTKPVVVADYLSGCFSSGGLISILALRGIFTLMIEHELEYPKYYEQLYSLITPDSFSSRHRYNLFSLLDVSMSSIRVPSYIVASFIKRIARVVLLSPAPNLYFALPFLRKLFQRHPNCLALIHRTSKESTKSEQAKENSKESDSVRRYEEISEKIASLFDGADPFLPDAQLSASNALSSTLWELTALERHFLPGVPLMVSAFSSAAEDNTPLKFEKSYARLFTSEVTRPMSKNDIPTVSYEPPEFSESLLRI